MRQLASAGVSEIILGLGGSATVDGGVGLAQALGVRFWDAHAAPLSRGGGALAQLEGLDLDLVPANVRDLRWRVACDVDNPLSHSGNRQGQVAQFNSAAEL